MNLVQTCLNAEIGVLFHGIVTVSEFRPVMLMMGFFLVAELRYVLSSPLEDFKKNKLLGLFYHFQ